MSEPADYYGVDGDTVTLTCTVKNSDTITIYWFLDGALVTNDNAESFVGTDVTGLYTIATLDSSHYGVYKCSLVNDATTQYSTTTVNFHNLDFTTQPSENYYKIDAESFGITCTTNYASAGITVAVEWFNSEAPSTALVSGFTSVAIVEDTEWSSVLTVAMSSALDLTMYTCKFTFSGDSVGTSIGISSDTAGKVVLQNISLDDDYQILEAGTAMTSVCTATGGSSIDILWQRLNTDGSGTYEALTGDQVVQGAYDSATSTRISTLTIASLDVSDASDNYECYVDFASTSVTATLNLDVVEVTGMVATYANVGTDVVFTCDLQNYGGTPVIGFYKNGATSAEDTEESIGTVVSNVQSTYTISAAAYSAAGSYYCKVTYEETAEAAVAFESSSVALKMREITVSTATPTYVHTEDSEFALSCTLKVAADSEISTITWYKDSVELVSGSVDGAFDPAATTKTTTYTDSLIAMDDGGTYKCEFAFTNGVAIYEEIVVGVHLLTVFNAMEVNPSTLVCDFEGSNEPTFTWQLAGVDIDFAGNSVYSKEDAAYSALAASSTLTITASAIPSIANVASITCAITFASASVTDPIATSTVVHFREMESFSDTQYYTGSGSVVVSCVFDFGADGAGPASVSWDVTGLTETTQYVVDTGSNGVDGQRTTTLTLNNPDSDSFAQTYVCRFTYTDGDDFSENVIVNIRLVEMLHTQYVHTNDGFTITCNFVGLETATGVVWKRTPTGGAEEALSSATTDFTVDDSDIANSATLAKASPVSGDDGSYSCEFQFAAGDASSASGDVVIALVAMTDSAKYYAAATSAAPLTCTVKNSVNIDIFWYKDGTLIVNADAETFVGTLVTGVYTIASASSADNGVYSCSLSNDAAVVTEVSTSDVTFTLMDVSLDNNYHMLEIGSSMSAVCTVIGEDTIEIQWQRQGTGGSYEALVGVQGDYDSATSTRISTYTIASLTITDANDNYECYVDFASSDTLTATLVLNVVEIVTPLAASVNVTDGGSHDFLCVAGGQDNTVFVIKWYIDSTEITDADATATVTENVVTDSLTERTSSLTITNNSPLYNGNVKCVPTWSDPEVFTIESVSDVDAIGASMNEKTYSSGNGDGELTCLVWGNAAPTSVKWYSADGSQITTAGQITVANETVDATHTHTLVISAMAFGDQADYTCTVVFADATSTTKEMITNLVLLSAALSPETPFFSHSGDVILTCVYSGEADPEYVEWFAGADDNADNLIAADNAEYTIAVADYNSGSATKTSTLTFNTLTVTDSGDYTCKWQNPSFSPHDSMSVSIRYLTLSTPTYSLDNSLQLTCEYSGTDAPTIEWFYGETLLTTGGDVTITDGEFAGNAQSPSLNIDNVTPASNAGDYSCKLSYTVDVDIITATSTVIVRTANIVDNAGVALSAVGVDNGELAVKCKFEGDETPTGVIWKKAGVAINFASNAAYTENHASETPENGVQKFFSDITLTGMTVSDDGVYSCEFEMSDSNNPTASVDVVFASISNNECVFVDTISTDTETLTCIYSGSGTALEVDFTAPDGTVSAGVVGAHDGTSQTGTFDITSVSESSDGLYTCGFLLNNGKVISAYQRLTARKAVLLTSANAMSVSLIQNTYITLTCTIGGGANSLTWYKDNVEMSDGTDYTLQANVGAAASDEVSTIRIKIASDSEGLYKCTGIQYDDYCTTSESFSSDLVTITVIAAAPSQEPASVTVLEGANHVFTCIFPDPSSGSSPDPEIAWTFNGETISSNGNYVANGQTVFDGTIATDGSAASEYTTTLSLPGVTLDFEGDFKCTFKWGSVFMESAAATLTVEGIKTVPVITNVVEGADALLTCISSGATEAAITFHLSSDDTLVDTVAVTQTDVDGKKESMGVLTITAVSSANAADYYCKATWSTGAVSSDSVYLAVINLGAMGTSVWGTVDTNVNFYCKSIELLAGSASGNYLDASGNTVSTSVTVSWEYDDGSGWLATSGGALFTDGHETSVNGIRTTPLKVGQLSVSNDGLQLRCTVVYDSDSSNNFIGGSVTSDAMTLSIAQITSFSQPDAMVLKGEDVTFTCVVTAQADAEPTVEFTGKNTALSTSRYQEVSEVSIAASGTTYTATYVVTTMEATSSNNGGGQDIYCKVTYANSVGSSETTLNLIVYHDCRDTDIQPTGPADDNVIIDHVFNDATGEVVATASCPADTDTARYHQAAADSDSGITATCDKVDGKFTPNHVVRCNPVTRFYSKQNTLSYNMASSIPATFCSDAFTGTDGTTAYTVSAAGFTITELRNIMTVDKGADEVCGPYVTGIIPCLATNECTLVTDDYTKTGCSYSEDGMLSMFFTVDFTIPVWTVSQRDSLYKSSTTVDLRFWSCTNSYTRRRRSAITNGTAHDEHTIYEYEFQTNLVEEDQEDPYQDTENSVVGLSVFVALAVAVILMITVILSAVVLVRIRNKTNTETLHPESGLMTETPKQTNVLMPLL